MTDGSAAVCLLVAALIVGTLACFAWYAREIKRDFENH